MKKYLNNETLDINDSDVFRSVYLKHWDKLYVYAYNILKDRDLCEDLIQDIFFALWKNNKTSDIQNISAYLFQSLRFRIYKHFRDTKFVNMDIDKFYDIVKTNNTPYDSMTAQDLEKMIYKHTQNLPKRCQEIFYLSRFECLSHKEIADKLNISIRTVKNQISIALKYLRAHMEEETFSVLLLFLYAFIS
ncbi:RNA polymerase sigma factor [Snuella sedimenti]|uniref:RNA polymerase sigma-70 factor n=1 Tax=Snuella sedimenti TaxID=2798802 RepID=A0A8J7LY10_9FLAO|nr:RNA polymerase sigma-70 factor [Snuella sedimenti]MBJ6367751.1 RNA polymerase sigma-70 factor [Snuella sedimenti]